ncbi:MAG: DUF4232 domain-containing protein [Acidimicrobiales bacterium]
MPASLVLLAVTTACGAGRSATAPTTTRPPAPAESTVPPVSSTPPGSSCTGTDLSASVGWQGATGSMLGGVSFTNRGQRSCALGGYLGVELHDQNGQVLHVTEKQVGPNSVGPAVTSPPVVVLPPGVVDGAGFSVQWFNWCGPTPARPGVTVTLPSGAQIDAGTVPLANSLGVPRCDGGPGSSSWIQIGPVEPHK